MTDRTVCRWLFVTWTGLGFLLAAVTASGQDAATTSSAADEQVRSYEESLEEWQSIDEQLRKKSEEFEKTDDITQRDSYRREYNDLLQKAIKAVDRLREAALKKLETDGLNKDLLKIVMGILADDARNGRDAAALQAADRLIALGIDPRYWELAATTPSLNLPIAGKELFEEIAIRHKETQSNDLPRAKIVTSRGEIVVELFENEAPNTVANFISLVKSGFYKDIKFHRVIEDFMAQTGSPKGDGTDGPGYTIEDECRSPGYRQHFTGVLSMAKTTLPDTGGSQFFITFSRSPSVQSLDGKHTVFGRVISGLDVVKQLTRTHDQQNNPIEGAVPDKILSIEILRDRGHEYSVRKKTEPDTEKGSGE